MSTSPSDPGALAGTDSLAALDLGNRFVAGEPSALREAFERWSALVHTMALRVTSDPTQSEDVVQVVFLEAWRSRERFDPGLRPLPAWLVGITRHVLADHVRSAVCSNDA